MKQMKRALRGGGMAATVTMVVITGTVATGHAQVVTPEGFENSTFVAYRAGFNVPNDGTGRQWGDGGTTHPLRADAMSTPSFSMWPHTSEYPAGSLQDTGFKLGNGQPALAYSSFDAGVIDKHFQWMQQYEISGASLKWFVTEPSSYRLDIGKKVQASAEKYGRQMFIEFDIAGTLGTPCGDGPALVECIKTRWKNIVDSGITASPAYKRFKSKPLAALFGIGWDTRSNLTAADAATLLRWFHTDAPPRYQASVMGIVPLGWRTNSDDAIKDDPAQWRQNYANLDILSPWTVGRYADDAQASRHIHGRAAADIGLVRSRNQRYLPVVFPGFSGDKSANGPVSGQPNQIPRRAGQFLWTQVREHWALGVTSCFVATFDDLGDGTALYKTASTAARAQKDFATLTLDQDGVALPSDWYLQVNHTIVNALKQPGQSGFFTSTLPLSFTTGELTMQADSSRLGGNFSLTYQLDGNLVIYDAHKRPLWASNTPGRNCTSSTCSAKFQPDGNLVLKQGSTPYWSTRTAAEKGRLTVTSTPPYLQVLAEDGTPHFTSSAILSSPYPTFNLRPPTSARFKGGRLSYQLDGNLVIYNDKGATLWSTKTGHRTCTPSTCVASFLPDGNFSLLENGVPYWTTGTAGSAATQINVSATKPYLSLYVGQGHQVWPRP